ncbi:MAG TPA: hypothetical protein GXX45_19270 [Pseudomonas aeruginosa]|uniref:hypothetical protein n=1 Tax=Pseudomonas aeruginosa TaxID=287 RepID=UPI000F81AE37|nr:hypothetical protein [Pseudomonas aeruginosa]EKU4114693.1 hypothetical protein [Pseudomonas aeruginosa]MBG4813613.1 hypothetical protein [Pseudomonas aeruginosa]MBG5534104.1 hypothetical protein [Pseudomonas aeruginosa]MBG7559994.1 hypothetical protein [Pseudomonas aeruginosa]MCZ0968074.1 hypothetical protein [Pseudomonas aeruginosa]
MKIDTTNFIGPTLASAALCFLAPLTKPKAIPGIIANGEHITITKSDNNLIPCIWLLIITSLFLWGLCCVLSNQTPSPTWYAIKDFKLRTDFSIGLGAYIVSLIMTMIKERV